MAVRNIKRGPGNPDWGNSTPIPARPTQCEIEVARLCLTRSDYAASAELKRWCDPLSESRVRS